MLASIHDFLGVNVHSLLCFMRGIHSVVMMGDVAHRLRLVGDVDPRGEVRPRVGRIVQTLLA